MAEITENRSPRSASRASALPYTPVALGAIAGHHRARTFGRHADANPCLGGGAGRELRRERALAARAVLPASGETDWLEPSNREWTAVRASVGVCDVSTLGKIDLQGPDAGAFPRSPLRQRLLDAARRQGVVRNHAPRGRLSSWRRHGLTARGRPLHRHDHDGERSKGPAALEFCHNAYGRISTCSSSRVGPGAQIVVAVPRSRDLLLPASSIPSTKISNEAFPTSPPRAERMRRRCGAAVPLVLFRRARLRARSAGPVRATPWSGTSCGGRGVRVAPYGTGGDGVMRIEKGHVAGSELNGQTNGRADLGLAHMMSHEEGFHRSLHGRAACTPRSRSPDARRCETARSGLSITGRRAFTRRRQVGGCPRTTRATSLGRLLPDARTLDRAGAPRPGPERYARRFAPSIRSRRRIPRPNLSPVFYDPAGSAFVP